MTIEKLKIYTDGGARGNPGPAAIGIVICDSKDEIVQEHCETILNNLLSNALKFTANGGKVSITIPPMENHQLIIKIKDTGIGIPKDKIDHVFDRFFGRVGIDVALVNISHQR